MLIQCIFALGTAIAASNDCAGDPGYTLTNPATVEPGHTVTLSLETPMTTFNILWFSLGEGPTDFPFGCVCLDWPPVMQLNLIAQDGGPITFSGGVPCDEEVIGVKIYQQFYAFDLSDVSNGGLSNQTSLEIVAPTGISEEFKNFSDVSKLQLNVSAVQNGDVLELTQNSNSLAGTAFYTTPIPIHEGTSFNTEFSFRVHGSNDGADGLTFMVQGNDEFIVGDSGGSLGYGTIDNSIAVEIDNYDNGVNDPSANHVGILWDGDQDDHKVTHDPPFDLEDAVEHFVWVDYCGATNTLEVFLTEQPVFSKPTDPIMVHTVDLFERCGDTAYLGFSAGTGGLTNTHDIESWSFHIW